MPYRRRPVAQQHVLDAVHRAPGPGWIPLPSISATYPGSHRAILTAARRLADRGEIEYTLLPVTKLTGRTAGGRLRYRVTGPNRIEPTHPEQRTRLTAHVRIPAAA